jgi:tetratricopeptide (TPR) repeat protein
MNAIVSGRSGRALLLDGELLKSFDLDDPAAIVPRKRSELPYLFGEAADLRIIENATVESVERELRIDCHFTWALDLVLISLDPELEDDIRTEALEDLEVLLTESTTLPRVEALFYSKPLPEDADLTGALELCDRELSTVLAFLERLEERQAAIASVSQAWETIPTKTFGSQENREAFRRVAVREELFHTLATVDPAASSSTLMLKAGLNPAVKQLPNYRQVLQAWTKPFRQSQETPDLVPDDEEDPLFEQRFGKRGRIDRKAVLREAVKKKAVIVAAMHRRDLARVEELVDELVAYHQLYSESQHTAKSLCDLAMEAKALGMHSLQLRLTERSINVAPGDSWSWAQHGDALLRMERLDEALLGYEQAAVFGAGAIAKKGRGEVLKAQGKFADALATFDEVIRQHPDDAVAKNSRAEVLKAQGKFADALNTFNEVIRQYPQDMIAKNGRAEVLKAQGQFAAALAAFDEVIGQYPDDVVAKTGRAEVLKAQGQFAAALTAFDEVIREHPDNAVGKTGRAEVLKTQGHFAAALTALDEVIRQHPDDVVAKNSRAEVLKTQGQFATALTAFDEVIRQHPDNVVAKNGRAEVFKTQGKFAEALTSFDEVIKKHPYSPVTRNGRSSVLVALGRYDEVLGYLPTTAPVDANDWIAYHIRGMCLLRLGDMVGAVKIFNNGLQNCPFFPHVEYFRGALALSWLRGRDFRKAGETLDEVTSPLLQPSANVIRIHAFGALQNRQRALQAYESLTTTPHLLNDELTQELRVQYVLEGKPTKGDEWVFDREVRMFLRVA